MFFTEPTLKSKACLRCLYFTKIISALCCYLEYFSYLYTINYKNDYVKKDRSESSVRYIHGSLNAVRKSFTKEYGIVF